MTQGEKKRYEIGTIPAAKLVWKMIEYDSFSPTHKTILKQMKHKRNIN